MNYQSAISEEAYKQSQYEEMDPDIDLFDASPSPFLNADTLRSISSFKAGNFYAQ